MGYITGSQSDHFSGSFIAHLINHYTKIAEIMSLGPNQALKTFFTYVHMTELVFDVLYLLPVQ